MVFKVAVATISRPASVSRCCPALAENHRVIAADWMVFNLIAHDYGGFLGLG
jgi:hypothetical protein